MNDLNKPKLTIALAKKELNAKFKKVTVKYENRDGKTISLRDSDDKLVRMIPTNVQLSPMDCTNVKHDKINTIFCDVLNVFRNLGMEKISDNIFQYVDSKGKGFSVFVHIAKYTSSSLFDSGYKDVYIDVAFSSKTY